MENNKRIDNSFIDIKNKSNESVKALFSEIGIDATDRGGRTLLLNSACYDNTELAEWAISQNAEINHQDSTGYSALHFAVQENNIEITALLLNNTNTNVDIQDNNGNTPLWRGIYDNVDFEIIELLIRKGANPKLKNLHEVAPIDLVFDEDENSKKVFEMIMALK